MQLTAINTAEAIFEAFWDPELREMDQWAIDANQETGTKTDLEWWCWVMFEWQNSSAGQKVITFSRRYEKPVDLRGYDKMLLSLLLPNGCFVRIHAETDKGPRETDSPLFGQKKQEVELELEGSESLLALRLEIFAAESAAGTGWLNWIGLQNSEKLKDWLGRNRHYNADWEGSLYPITIPVSFAPKYGIFLSAEQLDAMRSFYEKKKAEGAPSPFAPDPDIAYYGQPESLIDDFALTGGDTRYNRVRETGRWLTGHGSRAALYGVLEKDAESLRLAARYAMSILSCDHWDYSVICRFKLGSFDHRSFSQASLMYDLVFIYDLAHEYFTPAATSRLFRRLSEEGLSAVMYSTWRHEYIFHMNQLSLFSHGRMAAYSLLLKEFPRVRPYMEIAYQEETDSLQEIILPDGGYVEGPAYFGAVGSTGGQTLYLYARATGKSLEAVTPKNFQASVQFAEALGSTDKEKDFIQICDCGGVSQQHLAFMSALMPGSRWVNLFQKSIARSGGIAEDYFSLYVQSKAPAPAPSVRPYVQMADMRLASSHRKLEGKDVKLLVLGNKAGAGHTHEDKGSFVLEYAGQTFADDVGACDYSSSYSMIYKHCQRHNVLVPAGSVERPKAENPCMEDIDVVGSGDEVSCSMTVNPQAAYVQFYDRWERSIVSPTPAEFTVTDQYALKPGCGYDRVEFLWNTQLPVTAGEKSVAITGEEGTVVIDIPEGCRCELRRLEMFQEAFQTQIAFIREALAGTIVTKVHLQ